MERIVKGSYLLISVFCLTCLTKQSVGQVSFFSVSYVPGDNSYYDSLYLEGISIIEEIKNANYDKVLAIYEGDFSEEYLQEKFEIISNGQLTFVQTSIAYAQIGSNEPWFDEMYIECDVRDNKPRGVMTLAFDGQKVSFSFAFDLDRTLLDEFK